MILYLSDFLFYYPTHHVSDNSPFQVLVDVWVVSGQMWGASLIFLRV